MLEAFKRICAQRGEQGLPKILFITRVDTQSLPRGTDEAQLLLRDLLAEVSRLNSPMCKWNLSLEFVTELSRIAGMIPQNLRDDEIMAEIPDAPAARDQIRRSIVQDTNMVHADDQRQMDPDQTQSHRLHVPAPSRHKGREPFQVAQDPTRRTKPAPQSEYDEESRTQTQSVVQQSPEPTQNVPSRL